MKPVSILLALTLTTSLLPSRVDAQAPPAKFDQTVTLAAKSGDSTVAVLPANAGRTIKVSAPTGMHCGTEGIFGTGHVTIVVTVPGQTPVTITGDDLSLVPQK